MVPSGHMSRRELLLHQSQGEALANVWRGAATWRSSLERPSTDPVQSFRRDNPVRPKSSSKSQDNQERCDPGSTSVKGGKPSGSQSDGQSVRRSVGQSVRRSFSHSVRQAVRQSVSQTVGRSVSQSDGQSVSQSVRRSDSQKVIQSDGR